MAARPPNFFWYRTSPNNPYIGPVGTLVECHLMHPDGAVVKVGPQSGPHTTYFYRITEKQWSGYNDENAVLGGGVLSVRLFLHCRAPEGRQLRIIETFTPEELECLSEDQ